MSDPYQGRDVETRVAPASAASRRPWSAGCSDAIGTALIFSGRVFEPEKWSPLFLNTFHLFVGASEWSEK